jgi:hypothetical protein
MRLVLRNLAWAKGHEVEVVVLDSMSYADGNRNLDSRKSQTLPKNLSKLLN